MGPGEPAAARLRQAIELLRSLSSEDDLADGALGAPVAAHVEQPDARDRLALLAAELGIQARRVHEAWVDRLIEMGVLYTWFHIYRPVGPEAAPELALTPEQQRKARQFASEAARRFQVEERATELETLIGKFLER
jgi:hypothetical protein